MSTLTDYTNSVILYGNRNYLLADEQNPETQALIDDVLKLVAIYDISSVEGDFVIYIPYKLNLPSYRHKVHVFNTLVEPSYQGNAVVFDTLRVLVRPTPFNEKVEWIDQVTAEQRACGSKICCRFSTLDGYKSLYIQSALSIEPYEPSPPKYRGLMNLWKAKKLPILPCAIVTAFLETYGPHIYLPSRDGTFQFIERYTNYYFGHLIGFDDLSFYLNLWNDWIEYRETGKDGVENSIGDNSAFSRWIDLNSLNRSKIEKTFDFIRQTTKENDRVDVESAILFLRPLLGELYKDEILRLVNGTGDLKYISSNGDVYRVDTNLNKLGSRPPKSLIPIITSKWKGGYGEIREVNVSMDYDVAYQAIENVK